MAAISSPKRRRSSGPKSPIPRAGSRETISIAKAATSKRGTTEFGLPLVGVYADYPAYTARSGHVTTMVGRVQFCMERSMNGKPLPPESAEMTAIVSYLKFLSTGRPVGAPTIGRGSGTCPELIAPPIPSRDAQSTQAPARPVTATTDRASAPAKSETQKAICSRRFGDADSFNDGAGMNMLIDTANFIHSNMPDGTTWANPTLSPEDAWDVAAYIDSQPRPAMANFRSRLSK